MFEIIILLSIGCIVYLFTKKSDKRPKQPIRRKREWAYGRVVEKTDTVHAYEPEVIKQTPKLVSDPYH